MMSQPIRLDLRAPSGRRHYIHLLRQGNFSIVLKSLEKVEKEKRTPANWILPYAAGHGQNEIVSELIDKFECRPNCVCKDGLTSLHCAIAYGHLDTVKCLVSKGCKPGKNMNKARYGGPVSYVCEEKFREHCRSIYRLKNVATLHSDPTIYTEMMEYLIREGWDLAELKGFIKNCGEFLTPKLYRYPRKAYLPDNIDMIKCLVSIDSNIITIDLIVHLELENFSDEILHFLVSNCSDDVYNCSVLPWNSTSSTLLDFACQHDSKLMYIIAEAYLSSVDGHGRTPLHVACEHNKYPLVSFLVEDKHCDLNVVDHRGQLPLHVACEKSKIEIVKLVIYFDGINTQTSSGNTPLHIAASAANHEIVEYLVEANCILNQLNCRNELPLHLALLHKNTSLEFIRLLCDSSVDVNLADVDGCTPMHVACTSGVDFDIIKYLAFDKGGQMDFPGKREIPLLYLMNNHYISTLECENMVIEIIRRTGYNIDEVDNMEDTLLHIACSVNSLNIVRYLVLEKQCSIDKVNGVGCLPLHIACQNGSLEIVKLVCTGISMDKLLLKNDDGDTALHIACYRYGPCNISIVKYLVLTKGCKPVKYPEVFDDLDIELACRNRDDYDLLLALAVDENVRSSFLHIACQSNNIKGVQFLVKKYKWDICEYYEQTKLLHMACTKSVEMVESIVDGLSGIVIDNALKRGNSPLHAALQHKKFDVVLLLINRYKSSYDIQNQNGELPLHLACSWSLHAVKVLTIHPQHLQVLSHDGLTPLHVACKHNKFDIVQYLISDLKCDVNFEDLNASLHPLHLACEVGNASMVKFLVENGANTFKKSFGDNTPLHIACLNGSLTVVKHLVDTDHDTLVFNSRKELPLHIACTKTLDMVKIVSYKCTAKELEAKTVNDVTPLHIASSCGSLDIVKYLVEIKNCKPFILDFYGNNALAYACGLGKQPQVENEVSPYVAGYLVRCGCCPKDKEENGLSPIQQSICLENFDLFKELVENEKNFNSQDKNGNTSLMLLCEYARKMGGDGSRTFVLNAIKCLVDGRCDQNLCNEKREIPLHIACECDDIEVVKLLSKTLVIAVNEDGDMPLHIACRNNNETVLQHLLDGTNCNEGNGKGQTLLHLAVINNNPEMVMVLFSDHKKVDCSLKDCKGSGPIHYVTSLKVLQILLDYDVSIKDLPDANGDTLLHILCAKLGSYALDCIHCLMDNGAIITIKNKQGNTPLHIVCSNIMKPSIVDIVQCLLAHGAGVDITNNDKNTPLHLICSNIKPQKISRRKRSGLFRMNSDILQVINEILSLAPPVTTTFRNNDGNTPLHIACHKDSLQLVESLCDSKGLCDLSIQNSVGNTALHVACACACFPVVDYLLKKQMKSMNILNVQNNQGDIPFNLSLELFQEYSRKPRSRSKARTTLEYFANNCTDMNFQNKDEETLLHLACKVNNIYSFRLVEFFVKSGADISRVDVHKQLPLHIAASRYLNTVEVCFEQKIANEQDIDGNTPLHIACLNGKYEVVQFLLDQKSNPMVRNKKKQIPLHCLFQKLDQHLPTKMHITRRQLIHLVAKYTLQSGENLCVQDFEGNTPLHFACKASDVTWVIALQQYDLGDISLQNSNGETPLHIACSNSQLDIVKCLLDCNPSSKLREEPHNTALHIACMGRSFDIIECLIQSQHRKATRIPNAYGELPLHVACSAHSSSRLLSIVQLICGEFKECTIKSNSGDTPLHILCGDGSNLEVVSFLTKLSAQSILVPNGNDDLPLHIACRNKYLLVRHLELLACSDTVNKQNSNNNTSIHELCLHHVSVWHGRSIQEKLTFLIDKGAKYDAPNSDGEYPLHLACRLHSLAVVEQFLPYGLACTTNKCRSVLHEACSNSTHNALEIVTFLLEYRPELNYTAVDSEGDLALHVACSNPSLSSIVKHIIEVTLDINLPNNEGDTPLLKFLRSCNKAGGQAPEIVMHFLRNVNCKLGVINNKRETSLSLACASNLPDVVKFLLSEKLSEVRDLINLENTNKQTPIMLTTNMEIVQMLLEQGASTNPLFEMHKKFFHGQNLGSLPQTPVNFLVIGNPCAGKTTLVASLKKERGDVRTEMFDRTTGIVPSQFNSDVYGQVTMYDFAGQPEYYASHDTVIHNTIKNSPPIVVIVVNLLDSPKEISNSISYWSAFIKNRLTSLTDRAHLYIIFSHADILQAKGRDPISEVSALLDAIKVKLSEIRTLVFKKQFTMNCTSPQSAEITQLRLSLAASTKQLRRKGSLNFRSHCFFTFLKKYFCDEILIPVDKLLYKAKKEWSSYDLVPKDPLVLKNLCADLSENGLILFLENPDAFHLSWLILDKNALLANVSGTLFAPTSFRVYVAYGSNTGVVSFSKMRSIFPEYDPNMLFGFLCQMEYCQEIRDERVIEHMLETTIFNKFERYYFFPNVVKIDRPLHEWNLLPKSGYQFGWMMECSVGNHFSPSFVQILLLRLMFASTKIKRLPQAPLDIHSMSTVWKSGILWSDTKGIDTVVDVIENSKLLVLIHCNLKDKAHCLRHRSTLLQTIRCIKSEICPAVDINEFFITPKYIHHPLKTPCEGEVLVSLDDVIKSVSFGDEYVYSETKDRIEIKNILLFDPYSDLCDTLSAAICNPKNAHKTPSKKFLRALSEHLCEHFDLFLKIIQPSPTVLEEICKLTSTKKFCHLFTLWLQRIGRSFKSIKKQFDSITVFQTDPKPPGASGCTFGCPSL